MTARADRPSHLGGVRAWVTFGLGVVGYGTAVLGRTTLGVAGLSAVEHFHARASIIATFVVLQLLVYAAMQIPAGVLLDRYGSRRMLTLGLATMGIGQIVMAFADSVTIAIPGRMILGAGDAFVFSSVIRLLPSWFPPRRVPIVTQFVGLSGQLGQIVSALPFAWLLDARGWRTAFLAVSLTALAAAALSWTFLRDRPPGIPAPVRPAVGMRANLRAAARHPGTLLGMWTHWTTCFAPMVFGMMWGFPYLTQGEGVSKPTASLLIGLLAVVGAIVGPMLGVLVQRHPLRRSNLVLAMVAAGLVPWLLVLLWPGPAPLWLLVALCTGLAVGGPGSAIGFDFARTFNPGHRLGAANAVVNLGGFTACVIATQLIGLVLDAAGDGPDYTLGQFRLAMAVQLPLYAVGIVGMYLTRGRARRVLAAQGQVVPPWREALRREWRARTRGLNRPRA